jgi:hypothetical protein
MSKKGVLPPEWGLLGHPSRGERHEDAVALRRQVYQPDCRRALLFNANLLRLARLAADVRRVEEAVSGQAVGA